ncbi:CPBP family intramembrane metalloprotease [Rhodobacteraceae bacterium XHP0102]|nr:CPBP family intramembrane metalloprotease [Rhodobacteraceae bacterium XHP0102]
MINKFMRPSTTANSMILAAQKQPQLWRLAVGALICLTSYILGMLGYFFVIGLLFEADFAAIWDPNNQTSDPKLTLILLGSFVTMLVGPFFVAWLLHNRSGQSLFGPLREMNIQFWIAVAVFFVLAALSAVIPMDIGLLPNLELNLWLMLLPLGLLLIAIQTGAEEILFRGYLQTQLAARFRSPLIWALLPSVLFGLAHYAPSENGDAAWYLVLATGVFGLCAADLTHRFGTLGPAWGFHFANNVMAMAAVSLSGPLGGLALYHLPIAADDATVMIPLILRDIAVTIVIWLGIRFALIWRENTHR